MMPEFYEFGLRSKLWYTFDGASFGHLGGSVGVLRGHVLGLEAPREQYGMSLALALRLKLKSLASALTSESVYECSRHS